MRGLTQEQVIGQLLKHGEAQGVLLVAFQRRLEAVEHALSIRAPIPPPAAPPKKPTRR